MEVGAGLGVAGQDVGVEASPVAALSGVRRGGPGPRQGGEEPDALQARGAGEASASPGEEVSRHNGEEASRPVGEEASGPVCGEASRPVGGEARRPVCRPQTRIRGSGGEQARGETSTFRAWRVAHLALETSGAGPRGVHARHHVGGNDPPGQVQPTWLINGGGWVGSRGDRLLRPRWTRVHSPSAGW